MTSFLIALQFLTRIQLARHLIWTNEAFGASLRCFPLVGCCIGLCLCLCLRLRRRRPGWLQRQESVWRREAQRGAD